MNTDLVNSDLTTTSLKLAELFGRTQTSINRTIRTIIKDMSEDELRACNIARTSYLDVQGKKRPILQAIEKREPRDEQSLAVIMGVPSYYVRPVHDLLERNGYLTRETFTQTYHVYSATPKLGKLCIGKKGNTLLYDGKVKELVKLLLDTESLFAL